MLAIVAVVIYLTGCARFSTVQTDYSYAPNTNTTGAASAPVRKITTRVTAVTFLDSTSDLSKFKASQTDKTQGASVGSLSQGANSSNLVNVATAVVSAAINAAK